MFSRNQHIPYSNRLSQLASIVLCLGLLLPAASIRADDNRLVIKGSTTIFPIVDFIGREYKKNNPGTEVAVDSGGSLAGIRALIDGEAEIAASSTFISAAEIELARERGVFPVPFRIAYDCILPIVNGSNPVTNLSLRELQKIYRGEITNWRQLGGLNLKIEAVSRDTDSGTYKVWNQVVMQQEAGTSQSTIRNSSAEVVKAVAANPGAIGYIDLNHLNARVKPLKVNGVMGSTLSMKRGVYPLGRPLFLFTNGWPKGQTMEYINFVLDPDQGQAMIAAAGYIPLH